MTTTDEAPPPAAVVAQFDDLERAAGDESRVSFTQLVQVRRIRERVDALRVRALVAEGSLTARFEGAEGPILVRYGCRNILGGAALVDTHGTSTQQLFTVSNTDDPRLIAVETRCHEVLDQINEIAIGSPGLTTPTRNAASALYAVMTQVLDAVDQQARVRNAKRNPTEQENRLYEAAVAAATADLAAAERRATVIAERWARGVYLSGVAIGTVVTLLILAGVGALLSGIWPDVLAVAPLVTAGIFGTLGAVVSVFQRISTGKLTLDVTASTFELRTVALLRPVVGAVFAAVAELALGAGLLSVSTLGATTSPIGSFAVIGFVAGFSERFAIDAIERAGRVLAADDGDKDAAPKGGETLAAKRNPAAPAG